ncbi:MAG: hypothetical protein ACR2J9_03290, partial [Gaiellales bacterium]
RVGGRWLDGQRLRSAAGVTTTINTGRGSTAVAVTLTADGAVPARAVRTDTENQVAISSVDLTVRDITPPNVAWAASDPGTGSWQRGALCGAFTARDAGLGIDRVEFAVGGVQGSAAAGVGTRLQPRPLAFDGSVCVDSTLVGDGVFGTTLTAVDAGAAGNRSVPLSGVVRIDNTPPVVEYAAPTDPEARIPVATLAITDATSGVDHTTVTIDGQPALQTKLISGLQVRPSSALADGTHRLAWEISDVAGNTATGSELFGVADTTPPTIDTLEPQGIAAPTAAVLARASDTGAGLAVDGWRLAVDGIDVTGAADVGVAGAITYVPTRPWSEGEHSVRVTAGDRSGNRTVRAWTFAIPITVLPQPAPIIAPAVEAVVTAADSAPVPESVPPARATSATLALHSSARRVRVGAQVRLIGSASGVSGTRVRIEARVGRAWRLVAQVPISVKGTFATPVRLPAVGTYAVRARVGRLLSQTIELRAR